MPSDELKAPTTLHPTPTPSPESVTEPVAPTGPARWYGGSIWATDSLVALSVVPGMLVSLTAQRAGIGMMGVSLAGYLLAPAFVHAAHGNLGRGFLSVAMRAALPLLFGAIGGLAGCSPWNWVCSADGAAAGALVGYASAIGST
ncbi:MAG: hypothetical protein IPJ34_22945 [Myxococcales bacterium]|nr:hypothetical protein [Myxococcales bacterium]